MSAFTRRQLLGGIAVAGAGAVAGCSDGEADSGGTRLVGATIQNQHDEPHTVDVIVEFDDDIEYWPTHELADRTGDNSVALEQNWPSRAGDFRVTARLDQDGDTIVERTPADFNDPDCVTLQIEVGDDGNLRILSDSKSCDPVDEGEE